MSGPRRVSGWVRLALLVAGLAGTLGATQCGGSSGGGSTAPRARLDLGLVARGSTPDLGQWSLVEVRARAGFPYQAIAVDLRWTGSAPVTHVQFVPHPCFDDDGALFHSPDVDLVAGEARGLVDLRHGADAALVDACAFAYVVVATAEPADVTLDVSGDVARPDGSLFVTQSASLVIPAPAP